MFRQICLAGLLVVLFALEEQQQCDAAASSSECEQPQKSNQYHPPPSWNIHDEHPCNVPKWTEAEFAARFPNNSFPTLFPEPFIVRNSNAAFQKESQPDSIVQLFGKDSIDLPFANLFSMAGKTITLEDYIHLPETSSFDKAGEKLYMLTRLDNFTTYKPPPGSANISDQRFGIGAVGSGAQWHAHGPGFCEVLHGRKHWALLESGAPEFDRQYPSRHWFDYLYSKWDNREKLWECTLGPGDAIYFPNNWWHTTVNLDPYTAFVSTFYQVKSTLDKSGY
jgi:hypothetical protein